MRIMKLELIIFAILLLCQIAKAENIDSLAALSLESASKNIVVQGNYAYLTEYLSFDIVDLANPVDPVIIGQYFPHDPVWENYSRIAVSENYALLQRGGVYDAVSVFSKDNASDPVFLRDLYIVTPPESIINLLSYNNHIYQTDTVQRPLSYPVGFVFIYDVSDTSQPIQHGEILEAGLWYWCSTIDRQYAYIGATIYGLGEHQLRIIDILDPAHPQYVNSYTLPARPMSIDAQGDYVYIADHDLEILDVSDLYNPSLVITYPTLGIPGKIIANGNFVYMSVFHDSSRDSTGLEVVDVSNSQNPIRVGTYLTNSNISDFYVNGDYIYATIDSLLLVLHTPFTGIGNQNAMPIAFSLSQNYPNPFNAQTIIRYSLPKSSEVSIDIYDILGRKIDNLISERQGAGNHSIIWDARDASSGIYFYKIKANDFVDTKRCLLIK